MTVTHAPYWLRIPDLLIGVGAVESNIAPLTKKLGGDRILIVTDPGVVQAGLVDKVKQPMEREGINFGVFDGCEPNCPLSAIRECAKFAKQGGYDTLVGVGRGSTLDITKVTGIVAAAEDVSGEDLNQYIAGGTPARRGLPKILIPTTAGTGAEVSPAAVVTTDEGVKRGISSEYCLPEVAIIDPLMTLHLPQVITAETGIDVFIHAFEGYVCLNTHVVSDMLCETVMKLVSQNLREAYCMGPRNLEARYNMAIAASLGILPMFIAGRALVHAMGVSLQMETSCTHGVSCSVMLPHVMEFNMPANPARYARIAELMGENIENLTQREAAAKAIEAVRALSTDVGLPQRLRDIGVSK